MYVRTTTRKSGKGEVTYVQLAHNEWDPVKKASTTKVICSLGRADALDVPGIRRLVASLQRLIGEQPLPVDGAPAVLEVTDSRPAGGAFLLDGLWRQLGIEQLILDAGQKTRGRRRDLPATERILFGLVANRALAPSSKLAAAEWMNHDVEIPRLASTLAAGSSTAGVDEDACYRAMDWLHDAGQVLAKNIYFNVVDLLNLEVDVLFFDTTSTYFETGDADEPRYRDPNGEVLTDQAAAAAAAAVANAQATSTKEKVEPRSFRTWGKSKDSRDDLPQIVIGLAVTRTGIPVRVWSWPGNSADTTLIAQVRSDLREWSLSRIIYAADRGFASADNRRTLMAGGDGYILGEKLRSGSPDAKAALARQGRYHQVADNMLVKEVRLQDSTGANDRFIVCYNPDQATRDAAIRDQLVTQLTAMIEGTDQQAATKRAELRGKISTMPGLNRFLRVTPGGLLRVDKTKITTEANLDGKYLLRTSNPTMSAEDVALGYKQLLQVERAWRDLKSTLDLRPVYHRREERIRAHVDLCWLALLLIRVAENTTQAAWRDLRRTVDRVHAITYTSSEGTVRTHTTPTSQAATIFRALNLPTPARVIDATPTHAGTL